MRADGTAGVALCAPCHDSYMQLWRAADAELEHAELLSLDRDFGLDAGAIDELPDELLLIKRSA